MKSTKKKLVILLILILMAIIVSAKQLKDVYIRDFSEIPHYNLEYECTSSTVYANGSQKCLTVDEVKVYTDPIQRFEGIVYVDAMKIEYEGYFCSYHGDYEIHCVSLTDGYHAGEPAYCNKHGGMTCKIIKMYDFDKYKITETDGEIPDVTKFKTGVLN